ncbi:MAG: AAA family ATPase [Planctomycetota bacterium]|jgi:energy-coupling factor transporter ATP-binding protein EcfA2|nr:AAA family ATPase [Planctomycetota bacterium]
MSNAITRIEIKDFLVFKGEFAADFCPGVNVLIGANGTGKTILMKCLYLPYMRSKHNLIEKKWDMSIGNKTMIVNFFGAYATLTVGGKVAVAFGDTVFSLSTSSIADVENVLHGKAITYIPEKDILEHAKGLLTFIEQKQTGFGQNYKNVLISAQDVPTQEQTKTQMYIGEIIENIIGGKVEWVADEGTFYTIRTDGTRIPFANEASGFKKFGYLGLLVSTGQLAPGSILLWDEPENSLNPERIQTLVDILLELSRNGVQIFIATHSYDVARWFELDKKDGDSLRIFSLTHTVNGIEEVHADDYVSLPNNAIEDAGEKLYERVIDVAAQKAGVNLK